ncbi:uncharacterized protein V1510DRAFT_361984 [Dipodascopsis tothii]|uniref:uncharacterized protein n=1 Tax=Dipodascopsis tothii TaxID=44089 RepID=UPI0034CE7F2C
MTSQTELEAIRQDYMTSLEELTVNSKPIITNLTIIAQENLPAAEVITRAIEDHVNKCSPASKLPALYLLDSICKNVGSPYTLLFGRNLYKTFTDAYTLVPDPVRRKMAELFQTWKQPMSSTGQQLFSSEPVRRIDNFLFKARTALLELQQQDQRQAQLRGPYGKMPPAHRYAAAPTPYSRPPGHVHGGSSGPREHYAVDGTGAVTSEILLREIARLIDLTNDQLKENFADSHAQTQLSALTSLRDILVKSSLPHTSMSAIASLASHYGAPDHARAQLPPAGAGYAPPALNGADPSTLFASLMSAGLIPSSSGDVRTADTIHAINTAMRASNGGTHALMSATGGTGESLRVLMSADVELSSRFLQTRRPDLSYLLYNAIPNSCRTCGRRFSNSKEDRARRDAHLDWHFRINKRLRDETRGQSRSWFLTEEEWIQFTDADTVLEKNAKDDVAQPPGKLQRKDSKVGLLQKYIPIPTDPALAAAACPICKEKFTSEWHDKAEDWVWMNAVLSDDGNVYHATCLKDSEEAEE